MPAQRRFHLRTIGCKLNQADTAAVALELERRGMQAAGDAAHADVIVVNTCTVTARADADARQILRRLSRENPDARLVAMGCYARRDAAALEAIPGVHQVSPGSGFEPVVRGVEKRFPDLLTVESEPYHAAPRVEGRTRAYLKVQDGCNLSCSYCIIPSVRGRSRSLSPEAISGSLQRLVEAGFAEIVLTGVNTGDYGKDLPGRTRLVDLLESLCRTPGLGRLRLNSLEPRTVTPELIDFLAGGAPVAPHLQIPLQSGADRVLTRMRRNYRRDEYMDLLHRLAQSIPDIGLGADVIAGFPGEDEADFADTEDVVQRSPLAYLHVFSYSARPGTDAVALSGENDPAVIKARSARLRALAAEKGAAFRAGFLGRTLQAVTLSAGDDGRVRALTGNFFEVTLPAGTPSGRLLPVTVTATGPHGASGIAA